jgi:hypothetical protein
MRKAGGLTPRTLVFSPKHRGVALRPAILDVLAKLSRRVDSLVTRPESMPRSAVQIVADGSVWSGRSLAWDFWGSLSCKFKILQLSKSIQNAYPDI